MGLVETLVAVAVLGTSVVAFVVALSTGSIAVGAQAEEVAAQSLARSQLEYTKSCPFDPDALTYPAVEAPEGYAVTVEVTSVPGGDDGIQKITVNVSRESRDILMVSQGNGNRMSVARGRTEIIVSGEGANLITITDYKVNR